MKDTVAELKNIGEMLGSSATLYHATGQADSFKDLVGDGVLADALDGFDKAWAAGHERVHDNVNTFAENTDKIAENFTQTDEDTGASLDESQQEA
nr:hypothetical protein [Streptomyces sp. HNM0574]